MNKDEDMNQNKDMNIDKDIDILIMTSLLTNSYTLFVSIIKLNAVDDSSNLVFQRRR